AAHRACPPSRRNRHQWNGDLVLHRLGRQHTDAGTGLRHKRHGARRRQRRLPARRHLPLTRKLPPCTVHASLLVPVTEATTFAAALCYVGNRGRSETVTSGTKPSLLT